MEHLFCNCIFQQSILSHPSIPYTAGSVKQPVRKSGIAEATSTACLWRALFRRAGSSSLLSGYKNGTGTVFMHIVVLLRFGETINLLNFNGY
jgi:hypothetical protein